MSEEYITSPLVVGIPVKNVYRKYELTVVLQRHEQLRAEYNFNCFGC